MHRTAIAALSVILLAPLAQAQPPRPPGPGGHPGYSRALSDLRFARAVLGQGDWGRARPDRERAASEIDQAIQELRRAAIDDGRNPNAMPPMQPRWQPRDRVQQAMAALGRARDAISREPDDNRMARGWRDRAFRHIDAAQRILRHANTMWR